MGGKNRGVGEGRESRGREGKKTCKRSPSSKFANTPLAITVPTCRSSYKKKQNSITGNGQVNYIMCNKNSITSPL